MATSAEVKLSDDRPWSVRHHVALVRGARTALLMLAIAAVVMLALGLAIRFLGDPPEVDGWLRAIFGHVFTVVAVGMAAVLGIPAAAGLWAMAGANAEGAVPALAPSIRRVFVGIALVTVVVAALVLLVTGSAVTILNLGLLGLVALSSLGLAGAVDFSPHRGRATISAIALVLVAIGAAWVLNAAFIGTPG